jgi:hypothetical protein
MVVDHLSRLIMDFNEDVVPVAETFPDAHLPESYTMVCKHS